MIPDPSRKLAPSGSVKPPSFPRLESLVHIYRRHACDKVAVATGDTRDLTKLGRERRRECHKIIDLFTKYNDFTLEYNHLAAFPSSSFVNRT